MAFLALSKLDAAMHRKGDSYRLPPPCGEGLRVGAGFGIERARELRKRMTAPEARLWIALRDIRPLGFHFRRQVPLGPYYAEFAIHAARLVIEIDGDADGAQAADRCDGQRDAVFASEGYRVLRFATDEVMHNLDAVMSVILEALHQASPPLNPQRGEASPQSGPEEILP